MSKYYMTPDKILVALALSVSITACDTYEEQDHTTESSSTSEKHALELIYGSVDGKHLKENLMNFDIDIYDRAMTYAFVDVQDNSVVEWTSPNSELSGTTSMFSTEYIDNTLCREFSQSLTLEKKQYVGEGKACVINGQWVVQPK